MNSWEMEVAISAGIWVAYIAVLVWAVVSAVFLLWRNL